MCNTQLPTVLTMECECVFFFCITYIHTYVFILNFVTSSAMRCFCHMGVYVCIGVFTTCDCFMPDMLRHASFT